ncbi:hypothetical protein HDU99_002744, partial [Rhizoclosmatium hyalinum]
MRIKKLVMNLTCFRQVLDDDFLFNSFKLFAIKDSASEECFFWETYKDLYLSVM